MNIGQLDGQPLALQIFNGMTAESTCVNERWAKDQLFRCVCFAGGRHQTILDETVGPIFQSTSSVWRTTTNGGFCAIHMLFQSTSSVWRTTSNSNTNVAMMGISIHVLRVEDDRALSQARASSSHFNPRPPCGGRPALCAGFRRALLFQSTSSVWRTTRARCKGYYRCNYFNPRPPCGGRPHSPWRERCGCWYFNPRPPCGGRPWFRRTS